MCSCTQQGEQGAHIDLPISSHYLHILQAGVVKLPVSEVATSGFLRCLCRTMYVAVSGQS